ncbi:MAG: macrolide ABC transporter ATP-binding protein [Thermotoga sp.]|nr:MAG: macrolide ABC transporter ATP-binding protein [Thermotoga sp.]
MNSLVEVKNITKIYGMEAATVKALRGVSLNVKHGDFIAIMGASGSGKSTLLNIIGCLDRSTTGDVLIEGKNTNILTDSQLAEIRNEKMGFVFQNFNLLHHLNALENVETPMIYAKKKRNERLERAKMLLERVGLADRMKHLPTQMSGGERQRIAIARALANSPELLIADEPTGNLDSKTGEEILDFFVLLKNEGLTIILVTHEENIAAYADKIFHMKDGLIVDEEG